MTVLAQPVVRGVEDVIHLLLVLGDGPERRDEGVRGGRADEQALELDFARGVGHGR